MSWYFQSSSWNQLAVGIGMLVVVVLVTLIKMASTIGAGKALGKLFVFICIVVWVATGVVLIIRGLNKM